MDNVEQFDERISNILKKNNHWISKNPTTRNSCFIAKCKAMHGDRFIYSRTRFVDENTPIKVVCRKHGVFNIRPYTHVTGGGNCPGCKTEDETKEFIAKAIAVHEDLYDYSQAKYLGYHVKVKIGCKIHGYFNQTPDSHLEGHGCILCGRMPKLVKINNRHYKEKFGIQSISFLL